MRSFVAKTLQALERLDEAAGFTEHWRLIFNQGIDSTYV